MRFTIAAAAVALVAGVAAHKNDTAPVYVTEVVTAYTTYCPTPTEIVHDGQTYTVTSATTLTITNCPCTISHPVVPTSAPPAPPAPSAPYPTQPPVVLPPPVVTSKTVVPPVSTPTPVAPPAFTGAAARHMVGGAGAAAAFFGMAAYVL